jgi:hypothetical protein
MNKTKLFFVVYWTEEKNICYRMYLRMRIVTFKVCYSSFNSGHLSFGYYCQFVLKVLLKSPTQKYSVFEAISKHSSTQVSVCLLLKFRAPIKNKAICLNCVFVLIERTFRNCFCKLYKMSAKILITKLCSLLFSLRK